MDAALGAPPGLRRAVGAWLPVVDEPYDLAGPEHDTDVPEGPRRTYVLCSSPRSGSTLLSEALTAVGAAVPIEYFDPSNAMAVAWRRWGCRDLDGYLAALRRHRTVDGLFGLKIHWYHLAALAGIDGTDLADGALERAADVFDRIAPDAAVVRVQRRDRRRQALSWLRAERTRCWVTRAGQEPPPVPEVPDDEVERRRRRLVAEEGAWTTLLDHLRADPLVVTYEEMCADREGVVRAVCRHVGCSEPEAVPEPRLVRQSR